jgi:hypothetical protein
MCHSSSSASLQLGTIEAQSPTSDFGQNWQSRTGEIPLLSLQLAPLRPSYSDFVQNWQPRTGEIPLLSVILTSEIPLLSVILTSAGIGSPGPGDSPTLTVVGGN